MKNELKNPEFTDPHSLPTDTLYKIVHYDRLGLNPEVIEEMYNAKYIGEFSIKGKSGEFANMPVAIFYTEEAHPEGSNYMGWYFKANPYILDEEPVLMITDGFSATEHEWDGVLDPETGTILYSGHRHDYQTHAGLMADGGPEYLRSNQGSSHVKLKIVKDKMVVIPVGGEDGSA